MKLYIGVDSETGLVHSAVSSAANPHDITRFFDYNKVRYRGLEKNTSRLSCCSGLPIYCAVK